VLGCLVEKQLTTPQQYPLTRNALTLACSQATNREPVMALDEETVQRALQELKELHLVRFVLPSHGKSVTRYRHVLLRGPQTVGELRTRTGRMVEFDSLGAVQADLEVLAAQPEPLVRLHPRQPGQKEDRWQQLVATEAGTPGPPSGWVRPDPDRGAGWRREDRDAGTGPDPVPPSPAPADDRTALATRVDDLESEVMTLRIELEELTASLASLRQSLGE